MYKVGDKLVLKRDHALLKKGETVQVLDVEKKPKGYYWLKVMSTERYSYDGYILVRKGEEQDYV